MSGPVEVLATIQPPSGMVEISQQAFFERLRANTRDIMPRARGGASHWMDQRNMDGVLFGWSSDGRYFVPSARA